MKRLHTQPGSIRRYAMRPTADGKGSRSTDVGGIIYIAHVFLDDEALTYLCNRAALNKGGKAKSGPVHVKIMSREEVK